MKMNRTSAAAAVIAAGLVASLGALAPATVNANELTAAAPAATQSADADVTPSDDAAVAAVSAVALSDESTAAPEAKAPAATMVAEFNGTQYASFDEALAAAKDTEKVTIKLLATAETDGLNLDKSLTNIKDLTIDGDGHELKFNEKGIALWDRALTFKNVNVTMKGIGSTPYTAEWNWQSICASKGASLTLDGATLTMDGKGTANKTHAIYFTGDNKLNLINASTLTISNYAQDALEWDGGDGGYNVNITGGSTYTSDHCRSGFTGTFIVTVDNSKVNVENSTVNGSNGSHFKIKNKSVVDFSDNAVHGLSAGNLIIDHSTVTAKNNGWNGIIFTGEGKFTSADVHISGTKGKSHWNAGMRLLKPKDQPCNARLTVDALSTVSITDNKVTGLFLDSGAKATFAGSSKLMITRNDASAENASTKMDLAKMGGGVVVRNEASLTLPASAVIDNNNAALAGDDLYVEKGGTISFGATHNDALTEFDGCGHDIDGWYDDAAASRWSAHGEKKHVVAVRPANNLAAKEGAIALKAAHGLARVDYQYVGDVIPTNAELPEGDEGLGFGDAYTAKTQTAVDGYTFDGWYTDKACTTKWVDGDELSGSMTLYGKWTKNPETPATPAETQKPTTNKPAKKQVKKSVPKTGDETSSALPFALFGGAAAAIGLGIKSRRHE